MDIKGKAYANRREENDRPIGDFYVTPKSLLWTVKEYIENTFPKDESILEPCSGNGAISTELQKWGYHVVTNDLHFGGVDYLQNNTFDENKYVLTNPPFSLWDSFVEKAKAHSNVVMIIGRLNYLSTNSRLHSGIWEELQDILIFSRYVDYQTPYREDGNFHVGAMATGWFVWKKGYTGKPAISFVDVQKYATLGNFKK